MPRRPPPAECIFCAPDPCTCNSSARARKAAPKAAKPAVKQPVEAPLAVEPETPVAPVEQAAPVVPRKAGLRSAKTLGTVIPRPSTPQQRVTKPVLPKPEPRPTGRDDHMTSAIARFALSGLIDEAELRRHRNEVLISDAQFETLVEEARRRNGPRPHATA